MNLGGHSVILDGEISYTQNEETKRQTNIYYEEGQCSMRLRLPSKEKEVQEESEKVLKGIGFSILATEGEEVFTRRA